MQRLGAKKALIEILSMVRVKLTTDHIFFNYRSQPAVIGQNVAANFKELPDTGPSRRVSMQLI